MKDFPQLLKQIQSPNVQTYGYVFHDTNGPNRGRTLKALWILLNEICIVTHLPDCCGKDNLKKLSWDLDGKKYRIGNVFVLIGSKDCSCRFTWMT